MAQERIEVGKLSHISIPECQGNLVIRGGTDTAVIIKGEDYEVMEGDFGHSFSSTGDVTLTIPLNSDLKIGAVHGDLSIKNTQSDVGIQKVSGDVSMRAAAAVKIGTVHGDLAAKRLTGDLTAEVIFGDAIIRNCGQLSLGTVHGDLSARQVNGMAQLVEVMGDLNLRNIKSDITIKQGGRDANLRGLGGETNHLTNIAGDIRLYGPLAAGTHTFAAGGDIVLRWPDAAEINITAAASKISNWLPLQDVTEENGKLTGRIGAGNTTVTLTAAGSISLKEAQPVKEKWVGEELDFDFDFDFDMTDFSEKVNAQVFAHVNRITEDLEKQFGPDFSERIAHKAEKAAAKAEKAAERALRQAERSFKRSWPGRPPTSPKSPQKPSATKPKASEAEQLKILKMVEKGIISPDEAGTLLEALEN